jgi:type II secretory pathway component PulL
MSPTLGKARGWASVVFDEAGLRAVTAKASGTDWSVAAETSEPLAPGGEGVDVFGVTAQTLRQRLDLHENHIVTAIGCEDVLCQTLRLPTTDATELQQMLDLQIDNLTPLPIEEVVYSFESLEQVGAETRVLVAVARKSTVNDRVAALENVGWQPEIVGVDALAIYRELLQRGALAAEAGLHTLILVASTSVNLLVHSAGKLVAVRSVMLSGVAVGEPATQELIREELHRTLVAAQVERPGAAPGQVVLATAAAALRDPVEQLAAGWAGAQFLGNGLTPDPALSVCLETARAGRPQLNLLPAEWRERRRRAAVRRNLLRAGIALGAVYLLALVVFLTMMGAQKARLNSLQMEARNLEPKFKEARELQKTLLAMERQLDTKYSVLEVLREVSVLLPDGVKFNGFTFKKDDTIVLRAQAQSGVIATDFISRLEKSELFAKVTPGQMRGDPATGLTRFDVTCSLKSAAPGPLR